MEKYYWFYYDWASKKIMYWGSNNDLKELINRAKYVVDNNGFYQIITDNNKKILFEGGMDRKKPASYEFPEFNCDGTPIFEKPAKVVKPRKPIPGLNINPQRVRYKCGPLDTQGIGKVVYAYRLQKDDSGQSALLYLHPLNEDECGCFIFARKNKNGVYEQIGQQYLNVE